MAKKLSLSDLYAPSSGGGWAAERRREYLENTSTPTDEALNNRASEVEAILAGVEKEYGALTDDQYTQLANSYVKTGKLDSTLLESFTPTKADFSGTTTSVDSSAEIAQPPVVPVERSLFGQGMFELGAMTDALQGAGQREGAALIRRASLSDNPILQTLSTLPGAAGELLEGNFSGLIDRANTPARETVKADAAKLTAASLANEEATKPYRAELASRSWLDRNLGEGILDALASPSSAASIVGGPFGSVAIVSAYNQAYLQAIDAGVPSDDAELYAASQAVPEAISFLPAEKVLSRIPFLNKSIVAPIKKAATGLAERISNPAVAAAPWLLLCVQPKLLLVRV